MMVLSPLDRLFLAEILSLKLVVSLVIVDKKYDELRILPTLAGAQAYLHHENTILHQSRRAQENSCNRIY